MGLGL